MSSTGQDNCRLILTILKKRENYRKAYDYFNPQLIANYNEEKKNELLFNAGIVRNKLKIESSIKNAKTKLNKTY